MPKLNERGAIQFIVLLILLGGIAGGVYLATREEPFKLFPQAKVSRPIPPRNIPKPTKKPRPTSIPSPSPSPTPVAFKRVFVTSTTYNGNLGGLSGADAKCQERANAANLGGNWKAWLSDNTTSAASRLTHSSLPYKRLDDVTVANNWVDLTDGNLLKDISISETSSYVGDYVWSGTRDNGEIINPGSSKCNNWTSSIDLSGPGALGQSWHTDFTWSWNSSFGCNSLYRLYCFEQ